MQAILAAQSPNAAAPLPAPTRLDLYTGIHKAVRMLMCDLLVALGRMGDAKACQPIMEFMRQDTQPDVVGTAIFALGEIGDQSALPQLEAIQKDGKDEHLSRLASEAIAKIDAKLSPATVAVTVPALEDDRLRGEVQQR